ncbi:transcription factor bHLH57-like [Abrus precatorius]|uniref:Transcription factor bHLH57-like n=1 Tax=Abrus precatorius TaxID=3816 RepID=A0A8B8L8H8_ABRPR|nr:transcription factor bHLH57-like [Abrus precatorius]
MAGRNSNRDNSVALMDLLLAVMFFGEHLEVNCLEQGLRLKLEEDEEFVVSSLEDNMPFLQMLQSVESPQFIPFEEPSFQTLLRLKKPWEKVAYIPISETQSQAMEIESCVTHDLVEMQSPHQSQTNHLQHPHQVQDSNKNVIADSAATIKRPKTQVATRERRKRKRTRQTKNKEDVENQRMTHIAVERNRRRQMNEHLSVLKSLMPPSYIQRGDHASIIGGAIDFVKELEQLLQSLEAHKRMRKNEYVDCRGLFEHGYGMSSSTEEVKRGDEVKAEQKSETTAIEVTVIQTHVNLKIQCQKRVGQLIKAIGGLEDLRLTILHLNIASSEATVIYSFNLKIEEDSKIVSASEIAEAVNRIFSSINNS